MITSPDPNEKTGQMSWGGAHEPRPAVGRIIQRRHCREIQLVVEKQMSESIKMLSGLVLVKMCGRRRKHRRQTKVRLCCQSSPKGTSAEWTTDDARQCGRRCPRY